MTDLDKLKFTKTHEWVRLDGAKAVIGITAHAQQEISDVVFVELPKVGAKLQQAAEAAVVESVKAAFSIYAPVSGTVAQVNEKLAKDPGAVNRSPYEEGWIFVLEPSGSSQDAPLLTHEQYESFVQGEAKHA